MGMVNIIKSAAGKIEPPKRVLSFLLALFLVLPFLQPVKVYAFDPDTDCRSKGIYMVNLDTNTVVYERSANERMYPASLTKIMTAIVALENCSDLQETATSPAYIYNEFYGINVSHANIQAGETLTMENLLYAMLMQSANEAAKIVADHVGGGSIEDFVEMMNQKAKAIGANNTHFVNPHGLFDEEQYTTPYDMYLITKYAMELDGFMDMVTTLSKDIGPTNLKDSLPIVNRISPMQSNSPYYYAPIQGIKTGTLEESGRCFVSKASKDGYNYLLVLMNAPYLDEEGKVIETNYSFTEAKDLFEWAFEVYKVKTLVQFNQVYSSVKVKLGKDADSVNAVAGDNFTSLVMDEIEVSSMQPLTELPEEIEAPVQKGQELGYLRVMLAGEQIGTVPLVAAEDIEADPVLVYLEKIKGVFQKFWFKLVFLTIIIFLVLYATVMIIRNYNKKRYAKTRNKARGGTAVNRTKSAGSGKKKRKR